MTDITAKYFLIIVKSRVFFVLEKNDRNANNLKTYLGTCHLYIGSDLFYPALDKQTSPCGPDFEDTLGEICFSNCFCICPMYPWSAWVKVKALFHDHTYFMFMRLYIIIFMCLYIVSLHYYIHVSYIVVLYPCI